MPDVTVKLSPQILLQMFIDSIHFGDLHHGCFILPLKQIYAFTPEAKIEPEPLVRAIADEYSTNDVVLMFLPPEIWKQGMATVGMH